MNVDKLRIGEARKLASMFGGNNNHDVIGPWVVGKSYFIRTVTMHLTGTLKSVSGQELVLSDSAWIADSGKMSKFVLNPESAKEAELFHNDVIVGRGSIVDATVIGNVITKVIG